MEKEKRYFARKSAPKSQLIYVVLALFFGAFGIHNFYANRWGRGLIQLLLTLGTGFVGAVISSLWSVVNIFSIDTDGDGNSFHLNLPAKYICGVLGIIKYFGEIIFWGFLLVGFLTSSRLPMDWYNQKIGNRVVQETTEKIVTPTKTIVETSQTSIN